jgi:hypothetical protein
MLERSLHRRLQALRAAVAGADRHDRAVDTAMAPPLLVPAAAAAPHPAADDDDGTGAAVERAAQQFREQGFVQVEGVCGTSDDRAALAQLGLDLEAGGAGVAAESLLETPRGGASLLRALEQEQLCKLLATVVGAETPFSVCQFYVQKRPFAMTGSG